MAKKKPSKKPKPVLRAPKPATGGLNPGGGVNSPGFVGTGDADLKTGIDTLFADSKTRNAAYGGSTLYDSIFGLTPPTLSVDPARRQVGSDIENSFKSNYNSTVGQNADLVGRAQQYQTQSTQLSPEIQTLLADAMANRGGLSQAEKDSIRGAQTGAVNTGLQTGLRAARGLSLGSNIRGGAAAGLASGAISEAARRNLDIERDVTLKDLDVQKQRFDQAQKLALDAYNSNQQAQSWGMQGLTNAQNVAQTQNYNALAGYNNAYQMNYNNDYNLSVDNLNAQNAFLQGKLNTIMSGAGLEAARQSGKDAIDAAKYGADANVRAASASVPKNTTTFMPMMPGGGSDSFANPSSTGTGNTSTTKMGSGYSAFGD